MKILKRTLQAIVGLVLLLLAALIIIPYFFEDKIMTLVKQKVNENINATFDFKEIDLSLLENFPNISVDLIDVSVINKAPFERDTLFWTSRINLKLSLKNLTKKENEPYTIDEFSIEKSIVNVLVNSQGSTNYDIAKTSTEAPEKEPESEPSSTFLLQLQSYRIANLNFLYWDKQSGIKFSLKDFNHSGEGDFTQKKFDLKTLTTSKVSFAMGKTEYLSNHSIRLDAVVSADLDQNKYTFLENTFTLNRLVLNFGGYVKLNETSQEVDLKFKSPSSDFKSFLEMIPTEYTKSLDGVTTRGMFGFSGELKGIVDDIHIPTFKVDLVASNAMFKYPSLPKSVNDISMEVHVANTTGLLDDTTVDVGHLTFRIDQDRFSIVTHLSNLIKNPYIKAKLLGAVNLANVSKAYPTEGLDLPLKGKLDLDIKAAFDMKTLDEKRYKDADVSGRLSISGFEYATKELPHPFQILKMGLLFNPKSISLTNFTAKSGSSDVNLQGNLDNLLGYVFNDEKLKGGLTLTSNLISVSDFLAASTTDEKDTPKDTDGTKNQGKTAVAQKEAMGIPSFLDCTFKTRIQTVKYDDLTLKNVNGDVAIRDESVILNHLSFNIFEGNIILSGGASTKGEKPTFDSKMTLKGLDIETALTNLKSLKKIAPIASSLSGNFDANVALNGVLSADFTPELNSLSGTMLMLLYNTTFNPEKSKPLSELANTLKFLDLKKTNFDNVKLNMSVKDGRVSVEPFDIKHQDIVMKVQGSHGFDQTMDYTINSNVPIKYLGGDVNNLLNSAGISSLKSVLVGARIQGTFSKPVVKANLKEALEDAKNQVQEEVKNRVKEEVNKKVEEVKQDVLKKAEGEAKKLLNNLFK